MIVNGPLYICYVHYISHPKEFDNVDMYPVSSSHCWFCEGEQLEERIKVLEAVSPYYGVKDHPSQSGLNIQH